MFGAHLWPFMSRKFAQCVCVCVVFAVRFLPFSSILPLFAALRVDSFSRVFPFYLPPASCMSLACVFVCVCVLDLTTWLLSWKSQYINKWYHQPSVTEIRTTNQHQTTHKLTHDVQWQLIQACKHIKPLGMWKIIRFKCISWLLFLSATLVCAQCFSLLLLLLLSPSVALHSSQWKRSDFSRQKAASTQNSSAREGDRARSTLRQWNAVRVLLFICTLFNMETFMINVDSNMLKWCKHWIAFVNTDERMQSNNN